MKLNNNIFPIRGKICNSPPKSIDQRYSKIGITMNEDRTIPQALLLSALPLLLKDFRKGK